MNSDSITLDLIWKTQTVEVDTCDGTQQGMYRFVTSYRCTEGMYRAHGEI